VSIELWAPKDLPDVIKGIEHRLRSLWSELDPVDRQFLSLRQPFGAAWSGEAVDGARRLFVSAANRMIPSRLAFDDHSSLSPVRTLERYRTLLEEIHAEVNEQRQRLANLVSDHGELVRRSGLLADPTARQAMLKGADDMFQARLWIERDNHQTRDHFTQNAESLARLLSHVTYYVNRPHELSRQWKNNSRTSNGPNGTIYYDDHNGMPDIPVRTFDWTDDDSTPGFYVDPGALREVAEQMDQVAGLSQGAVDKVATSALGRPQDEPLAPEFEDMVNTAVAALRHFVDDTRRLAGGLRQAANEYERGDATAGKALSDVGG
jgi:hypothetical protein